MMLRGRIRQAIIDWLGPMFDEDGRFAGNPDYRDLEDVDKLVDSILKAINW